MVARVAGLGAGGASAFHAGRTDARRAVFTTATFVNFAIAVVVDSIATNLGFRKDCAHTGGAPDTAFTELNALPASANNWIRAAGSRVAVGAWAAVVNGAVAVVVDAVGTDLGFGFLDRLTDAAR